MVAYTVDYWRQHLASNHRRTYMVIFLFILTYVAMGLWIDCFIIEFKNHRQMHTIIEAWVALVTTPKIPWATLTLGIAAVVAVLMTIKKADRLLLLGTAYHEINTSTCNTAEKKLLDIVEEMKIAAGLKFMPKVYIVNAPYMNAFASGFSEKSASIALTSGLIEKLNREEIEAVMAHEISHIRHMDIKLTLMISALGNIAAIVLNLSVGDEKARKNDRTYTIFYGIFWIIFCFLKLYLIRTREFMADDGAIELTRDNQSLAHALIKISDDYQTNKDDYEKILQETSHENLRREAYIFDPESFTTSVFPKIKKFFATHPPLEARLRGINYQKDI